MTQALEGIQKLIHDSVNEQHCLGTGGEFSVFKLSDPALDGIAVRLPIRMVDVHAKHGINITDKPFDIPKPQLKRALLRSTVLKPNPELYIGDGIGQTLMQLYGHDDGTEMYAESPSDHEIDSDISLIRLEKGQPLAKLYKHATPETQASLREEFAPHYRALQEKVARLGYHCGAPGHLIDSHGNNILFDTNSGFALIDAYNPVEGITPAIDHAIAASEHLVDDLMDVIGQGMSETDKAALNATLEKDHTDIVTQLRAETLPGLHETGFASPKNASDVIPTSSVDALSAEIEKLQQQIAGAAR